MMDFLRRLAPPRETDATRAVALLPSRFASASPLREPLGESQPARNINDDDASLLFDATELLGVTNTLPAQPHPLPDGKPSQATPRQRVIAPTHPDYGKTAPSTHSPAKAADLGIADPGAFQLLQGAVSRRAGPTSPELNRLDAPLAASAGLPGATRLPSQPRITSPLSQAALAQRTLQSRDDGQVVHVTIGRIDVVASTGPAPAARRNPAPREPRVTLSDYLRGGNGGRR